jgi:hypothetical protein
MRGINECPKCGKACEADPDRIGRFFRGMCRKCAKPKKGELPSQEFIPPSALGSSVLFKEQYRRRFEESLTDMDWRGFKL